MDPLYLIGLIMALALFLYLGVVLFLPEHFS
ncbi:MAG: potassium-transporting ATPase subunit F [Magnetococcales bacterium]|nr:potassium-transporting ATPase subunit F [Magnetococcales bacterium]